MSALHLSLAAGDAPRAAQLARDHAQEPAKQGLVPPDLTIKSDALRGDAVGGPAELGSRTPPGFTWYALREGESLSSVAGRFGLSISALVGANPDISSLDRLPKGFELLIPPSAGLVVRFEPGDTREVELVELGGLRRAVGFNGLSNGSTATAQGHRNAVRRAREQGFVQEEP